MTANPLLDRCHFLEDRCAAYQSRIRDLEYALGLRTTPVIPDFTPTQMKLVSVLLNSKVAHKDTLMIALFYDRKDKPSRKCIDVHMCNIRKKFKRYGVEVYPMYRYGYFMRDFDKKKVNALLASFAEASASEHKDKVSVSSESLPSPLGNPSVGLAS